MLPVITTIEPVLWKPSEEGRKVFAVLNEGSKGEPQVLFVGGYVRNAVLGQMPGDADVATIHKPDEVTRRLAAAGIKVVPTGIDHGTVTAVVDGKPFEITTLRRDVETDGRHAVVAFTGDWNEDAQRRDFTMNTLLADMDGNVYDPTGRGLRDLHDGRVVFVGDPAQRIAEDYLRILRFFRFQVLYGKGAPDIAALAACKQAAAKIPTLSRERITQEILKILAVENPTEILEIMRANNVIDDLFHPEFHPDNLNMLCGLQNRLGAVSVEARLFVLCNGDENQMQSIDKYLLLSKDQRRTLGSLFVAVMAPMGIKERLYFYGRDVGGQSVLVLGAMENAKIGDMELDIIRNWAIPVLPLTGDDLKSLGIAQGPRMGEIMRDIETWWAEWDFEPGRDQCLDRARILSRQI